MMDVEEIRKWHRTFKRDGELFEIPLLLAENIVLSASKDGDTIYDPFMGSGTTALAACKIGGGRNYIGSEISEKYVQMAEKRIHDESMQLTLF